MAISNSGSLGRGNETTSLVRKPEPSISEIKIAKLIEAHSVAYRIDDNESGERVGDIMTGYLLAQAFAAERGTPQHKAAWAAFQHHTGFDDEFIATQLIGG